MKSDRHPLHLTLNAGYLLRAAAPFLRAAVKSLPKSNLKSASGLLVAMMLLTACSDVVAPPKVSMDRVAAARLMPAVTDARLRLAAGIDNAAIRERVVYDLTELEVALSNGDANGTQFRVRLVSSVLADYKAQPGSSVDKADVTGILLAMNAVNHLIGNETLTSLM